MNTDTASALKTELGQISVPGLSHTLASGKMLKEVTVEGQNVTVQLELPIYGYPHLETLQAEMEQTAKRVVGEAAVVKVDVSVEVRGKNTGGSIGLRVKNVIAVGSGKGGVGKSTVASSLAYGLKHLGASVGILDADVYGPSIPHMTGASGRPEVVERRNPDGSVLQRIQPVDASGMPLMSIGFMIGKDDAVIWRGPMLDKLLRQFLKDTDWGELDYLVIDMPPGTGDVALTLSQLLGLAGAVVVCTPQQVALLDAVKAVTMYGKVNIPVLGMIENMTGEIFGRGGAKQAAEELNLPFLGELPINATVREHGDNGQIAALYEQPSETREALIGIAQQVSLHVAEQAMQSKGMPELEIL